MGVVDRRGLWRECSWSCSSSVGSLRVWLLSFGVAGMKCFQRIALALLAIEETPAL